MGHKTKYITAPRGQLSVLLLLSKFILFHKMILNQTGSFFNTGNNFVLYFFPSQKHFILTYFGLHTPKLNVFSVFLSHNSLFLLLIILQFFSLEQIEKELSKSGKRKPEDFLAFHFLHSLGLQKARIIISFKPFAPISVLIIITVKNANRWQINLSS